MLRKRSNMARLFASDLRTTMTAAVVTVASLAVVASVSLIGSTTLQQGASRISHRAVESVRHAETMQRVLLLHDRVHDANGRTQIATRIRERLEEAHADVVSSETRTALENADRAITAYLATADDVNVNGDGAANDLPREHAAAFSALEKLVALETRDSNRAAKTAQRYDELADVIGVVVATVTIGAAALMVWWLRARALLPLFDLAGKMRRFGNGGGGERASEDGPAELAEMARRFNEMAEAIARQRKERQTFIAGVAHDLRTPLAVLRMSTDLATRGPSLPPERMVKVLGAVGRQVDRLERMVGDLLDSASIEAGNVRLRLEEHDARIIAAEVAELYAATSATHVIDLAVPEGAVPLRCDGMRLEQVLSNLVNNAIKYSPEGGHVAIEVASRGSDVVFVVRDEGVGMTADDAARAFEPFRRSESLRDQVPGFGLGLFVVRKLVEAHEGRIDLRTAPGTGSTFEVTIPTSAAIITA
jgi:signal transduction histidine kinase